MTRDDIIRMAKEAGFEDGYGNHLFPPGDYMEEVIPVTDEIVRFAALVAAAEREACAVVCERLPETFKIAANEFGYEAEMPTAENYAAAIRTRDDA